MRRADPKEFPLSRIERVRDLLVSGPQPIDGGLATLLEARGHDLSDALWSARVLADDPAAIASAHREYVDAGARVLVTASYQVSRQGFRDVGRGQGDADHALRRSVELAKGATGGDGVLVAASVGPYGAITHDGGEYRGRYGLSREQLTDFHRARIEILVEAEPDLLAIETIPDADEVAALVDVLAQFPEMPAWITVSCADGARTNAGQPVEEAAVIAARAPTVMAVGVNCTAPAYVAELLARMHDAVDLPLVVYPNTGRSWDPMIGWVGPETGIDEQQVSTWLAQPGVSLVGGCCGIGPQGVSVIAAACQRVR